MKCDGIPRFWAVNGRPCGYTFANGSENAIFTFIFHSPFLHEKKDFPQEVLFYSTDLSNTARDNKAEEYDECGKEDIHILRKRRKGAAERLAAAVHQLLLHLVDAEHPVRHNRTEDSADRHDVNGDNVHQRTHERIALDKQANRQSGAARQQDSGLSAQLEARLRGFRDCFQHVRQ